jgi:glycolate oxidase subunit GlcD
MTETWVAALRAALGERVHTLPAELAAVARDASHVIGRPEALLYPETSEHVATAVRIAREHGVPIVARGGGTSLTGATVPTRGGLVIAFNRMQAILELDVAERTALVQPGHTNAALDREARRHGLRYTPDPSSRAASVIGGNIGTNAGGLHCLGHGVTADHVLGLEVVFGDGTIAWLEDTDIPDLRALVTGSEGTLAIVTSALVRLLPLPERLAVVVAGFELLEQAGACAERMVLEAPGLVACEFIDDAMLRALDHMAPGVLPVNVEAALLIEVEALEEGIDRAIAVVVQCVEEAGGSAREARSDEEIEIAWHARRSAYGALGRMHSDSYTHDFATPRDRLVTSLRAAADIAKRHDLVLSSVAHLGDGNLHPRLHYDARVPGSFERALKASEELLVMVLANGGTLTGEHGIGLEKLHALGRQYGEAELDAMRRVKAVLDPAGILNPGKRLPEAGADARRGVYADVA